MHICRRPKNVSFSTTHRNGNCDFRSPKRRHREDRRRCHEIDHLPAADREGICDFGRQKLRGHTDRQTDTARIPRCPERRCACVLAKDCTFTINPQKPARPAGAAGARTSPATSRRKLREQQRPRASWRWTVGEITIYRDKSP